MKKLKAFFAWLMEHGYTLNRPFEGFKIGAEKFGTPYYISLEERKIIQSTPMPTKHLSTQRDIFVFQCLIGARVGDMITFTEKNIIGEQLQYIPHKTKDEGQQALQVRVPLGDIAQALLAKYKGKDFSGRLFPFISKQKYNDAIKEIFTIAGITRMVEVHNPITGEMEQKPINTVASSHMARRTFIGNLYHKVQDPNIIGAMSGHVDGSKALVVTETSRTTR